MHAKNFVKVVNIGEVMARMKSPILILFRLTYLACIALRTGAFISFRVDYWQPICEDT